MPLSWTFIGGMYISKISGCLEVQSVMCGKNDVPDNNFDKSDITDNIL